MIKNKSVDVWINEMSSLLRPEEIVWVDGGEAQKKIFQNEACKKGILTKLNEKILPGCFLHRSNPNDVARVEERTFICCENKDDAGFTNNWCMPNEMLTKLNSLLKNSYIGLKMYIIPFSMGPIGSKFSKLGIEITDSLYVVLSMLIMTRVGEKVFDEFEKVSDFTKCIHASCSYDENERYICHFPERNTVISVNSSYGGNALLGKKSLALRLASVMGRKEGWLAEHMLILGIKIPNVNEIKYIAAAFPSGCGKTNLAMLVPPREFEKAGYKVWCVGDDIAWLRIGKDGRLWAVNPENGFFGVAVGTNIKTNPNALESARKNTIFTNVVHNLDENTVWWEGLSDTVPQNALDWKGQKWDGTSSGAHRNSRFTAPAENCPCVSPEFGNPYGVPISAIIFGGRRSKTAPLVFECYDWAHGVFTGSIMSSETTAAATGKLGVLRHDPFAMLPFCGYNMGDYFAHWLEIRKKLRKKPKIFSVNWFRTDRNGKFLWPGFGENIRVLEWIVRRSENSINAHENVIGLMPLCKDFNLGGIDIDFSKLFEINKGLWTEEIEEIKVFYKKIGKNLPKELWDELSLLELKIGNFS
jgi:phosphoenolpyruvate carboxykinase (GTP)